MIGNETKAMSILSKPNIKIEVYRIAFKVKCFNYKEVTYRGGNSSLLSNIVNPKSPATSINGQHLHLERYKRKACNVKN